MEHHDWNEELARLERIRDELRLKAHLFGAEVREQWEVLERDLDRQRGELGPVREAMGESAREVGTAVRLLAESLRAGFDRVRHAAREH